MRRVRTINILVVLTLFFSTLLFFSELLGERYLLTERDLAPYFIPPRFFWVESLKGWDFPLWNPYQFSGHPFFANPQHAILYPLNGFFFLFPFDIAFNFIILLHFFLAGVFTYLLLRDLKVSSTGSLISGLTLVFSGYLLSVHSLLNIFLSVIWTPLIILFFRRAMERPGFRNEVFTAIFMTLSFLGGGIEIVYGNFFVLFLMMIFPLNRGDFKESLIMSPKDVIPAKAGIQESTGFPRIKYGAGLVKPGMTNCLKLISICVIRFKSLFIISILFLFLSAIQVIPFLELWIYSIRGDGITYQEATTWSFAPKDFLLFFLPDAYGYFLDMKKYWVAQCWLKTMYTGGLPFLLSAIFFFIPHPDPLPEGEGNSGSSLSEGEGNKWSSLLEGEGPRRNPLPCGGEGRSLRLATEVRGVGRGRILFLSLMFFSLFLSLGQHNPLYPFVYKYVPFFNGIRYPVKFLYIFILTLSMTAGLGFDRLVQFSKEREKKRLGHLFILFSLISGFLLLFLVLGHREVELFLRLQKIDFPKFNHLSVNLYHAKRFLFYLTLFLLILRIGDEVKWKGWAKVLLIFFLIADLFGNMGFYGKEKSEEYFKKTKIVEIITSDKEKESFRVFSTGKTITLDTPILVGQASHFDLIKEKHLPSLNMIFQIPDIWGVDVVRLKRGDDLYKIFTNTPSISATHLIEAYGVKYVVSVTPLEGDSRFELVYARLEGLEGDRETLLKQNTIKLYKVRNPLQRAWLVKDFKVMDSKGILSTMTRKDFDPREEVLLEEKPPTVSPAGERDKMKGNGEVKFISETNNRLSLKVEAEEGCILILSDTFYSGWKVFVDGKEEKILQANYNFRAVPLGGGIHQVEFIYHPLSLKIGAILTILGVISCFFLLRIRRKFPYQASPSQIRSGEER